MAARPLGGGCGVFPLLLILPRGLVQDRGSGGLSWDWEGFGQAEGGIGRLGLMEVVGVGQP